MTVDWKALAAPFPPDLVSWRIGSTTKDKARGMALCFIDARDVMNRLDDVCSPAGWQCRYSHAGTKTVCDIGIKVGDEWVWKADGAGDTDVEAEKGSLSDAFKRGAVRWGIGRYLYDLPSPWVALDDGKRIAESEMPKLRALLAKDAAKPVAPTAPKPAPEAVKHTYSYVSPDGITTEMLTGREFFSALMTDLKATKLPKDVDRLWRANHAVAQAIVENLTGEKQEAAKKAFEMCISVVADASVLAA